MHTITCTPYYCTFCDEFSPLLLPSGNISVDESLQVFLPVTATQELGLDLLLHLLQHPLLGFLEEIWRGGSEILSEGNIGKGST